MTKKWTLPPGGNLFGVQHIPRVHEAVASETCPTDMMVTLDLVRSGRSTLEI